MIYEDIFLPFYRITGLTLIPRPRYVWGEIAGAILGPVASILGSKKKVAPAISPPIDAQAEQLKAIKGNLANQADIEQLVGTTNKFNQGQAISLMEQAMPGYTSLSRKLTGLASNLADHPYDVPADVQANMQRLAAERGISTGRHGQASEFSLLRDLGVNQLQYGQSAIGQASGLTGLLASIAPKVNPMSPMSMYLSPQQVIQTAEGNRDVQQGGLNAQAAAQNANAQTQSNMWGQIGGAAGSIFGNLMSSYGGGGSGSNPAGIDTSKNGAWNDMEAAMMAAQNKNTR